MKCFIDGNTLCVVRNDFVNLQDVLFRSEIEFFDLTDEQLTKIKTW